MAHETVGCLVLAAGHGRRFGANKLLQKADGKPLAAHVLDALPAARFAEVRVVTRYEEVAALAVARHFTAVRHDLPCQSDSIRAGLYRHENWDGCLFVPADQPFLTRRSIARLVDAFCAEPTAIWQLGWGTSGGSPVIFPKDCFPELLALQGDVGGKAIWKRSEGSVTAAAGAAVRRERVYTARGAYWLCTVQADSARELVDIDTPKEWERCFKSGNTEK